MSGKVGNGYRRLSGHSCALVHSASGLTCAKFLAFGALFLDAPTFSGRVHRRSKGNDI
jgi:hypothetical protein